MADVPGPFDRQELRDLGAAWAALTVAFTMALDPAMQPPRIFDAAPTVIVEALLASAVVVGAGVIGHELAHKALARHYGQQAAFRATYPWLGLSILAGAAGWIVAAPGAVYHRGRITARQRGLIALAGPASNMAFAIGFAGLLVVPGLSRIAVLGLFVNLLLAGFNMLPAGPLDGRSVLDWHRGVYAVSALLTVGPAAAFMLLPLL
ncbi:metalloprotease [Halococcoides cellulosivorans]|uniref:Metalloprotease n=1 Tax=Halococcoides cellulosivorans TaxID=1679096 RepID=A0A2R4WY70_9EURY|nr:metalloprotease [Halococcoides cellulosivorans]AWB26471.1 metalloprotease [Halococcoides cellulosivorans]